MGEELEEKISDFREIAKGLRGCAISDKNGQEPFQCKDCPLIGDCLEYVSLCVSVLCDWVAEFMETGSESFVEKIKNKLMEEQEEAPDFYA